MCNLIKDYSKIWRNVQHNIVKFEDLVCYLYQPTDPASLGVVRFLFGLLMVIDITEERGGSEIDIRWGHSGDCHFPLFSAIRPLPYPFMCLLFGVMWLGAIGIMLGLKFRATIILFTVPYWYILLLEKSYWNNHSYLYGIVGILLIGSSASNYFSVDGLFNKQLKNQSVPYWNYFVLKYQFFMLYFLAGLKKSDSEWLAGYSARSLGQHWVFSPFRIILSTEQVDYLVIHWFGFILDLTVGFGMLFEFIRPLAMVLCAMFHLINSRLFDLGVFSYVCLATLPLFCKTDWPKTLWSNILQFTRMRKNVPLTRLEGNGHFSENNAILEKSHVKITFKQKLVVVILLSHMVLQAFLPYSHFITKGYNNWTNGLYGYSWDMMMHSWETVLVVVKVVDNQSGEQYFMNNKLWLPNDRWTKHADMCLQYAECVKNNLEKSMQDSQFPIVLSKNISIYIDVWCSLNKRFQQRMYDPNYDLLRADWSPFRPVEWLLPVMTEYNDFRRKMDEISDYVHSWNSESDVMFVADFPGMFLENYISEDLSNISLIVLEGEVFFELEDEEMGQSRGVKLGPNQSVSVPEGLQHRIHTISKTPSCYMYTFSKEDSEDKIDDEEKTYSPFPLLEDLPQRKESLLSMLQLIWNATLHLLFGHPLEIRRRAFL